MSPRSPSLARLAFATVACALVALAVACENGAPNPGDACKGGGGECRSVPCADDLPQFDCGSGQYCCHPAAADGGASR